MTGRAPSVDRPCLDDRARGLVALRAELSLPCKADSPASEYGTGGEATSTVEDVTSAAGSRGVQRYVDALAALPGAEHVAVVDVAGSRVLGEWGGPAGSAQALLDRARRAAEPSRQGRRELDDVVSTSGSTFHLSRLILAGPGHPESVWVAVRIDRARGSLMWSRGILAGLDGPAVFPRRPETPGHEVHRASPEGAAGEHQPIATASPQRPTVVPPPPVGAVPIASPSSPAPAPAPAPSKSWVALRATTEPLPPTAEIAAEISPTTASPAAGEAVVTEELAAFEPMVPAARPSPENAVVPPAAEAQPRSSFAPVMVVPPPASPVPDDGTSEEPAPMPAPTITAPPLGVEGPTDTEHSPEEAGVELPDDDRSGRADGRPGVPLVPRRPAPAVPSPTPPSTSETGGPTTAGEPTVLRRLFHGLRRPSSG